MRQSIGTSGWIAKTGRIAALVGCFAIAGAAGFPSQVQAQNLYAPVAKVNDDAVTAYERSQRMAFLRLLRAPGDIGELAMEQLINEKLQLAEADRLGVTITDEALKNGMAEFAARGNLETEQLLTLLAQGGIAAETFRDFVQAGLIWREVARTLFLQTTTITETEIDRAYADAEPTSGTKVLLTEIVLPASTDASRRASMKRADRLSKITDADEFSRQAVRFSTVNTRLNKGQRDWVDLEAMPPEAQRVLRGLKEGRTSRPVYIENVGVIIYHMRDRETIRSTKTGTLLDYAAFLIPGGRSPAGMQEAAKLRGEVDVCDDLYPIARGLPAEQLIREELPASAVPSAYRAELANLDPGEISTNLTTANGALVFLMLCNRRNDVPDSVTRGQVAEALRNRRIGAFANDYLSELRAQANIEILR